MPFVYKPEMASKKQQIKLEEAARRREEVFSRHPEIAELDETIKKKEFKLRGANFHGLKEKERQELTREIRELKEDFKKLLAEKNIPPDFKEPRWDCSKCRDRGEVLTSKGYVRCSCRQEVDTSLLQKQAGLPPRFARATFDRARLDLYPSRGKGKENPRVQAEKAFQAGREFVRKQIEEKSSQGLFIDGPTGSGKTFLLACIANELMASGRPVRYISYSDFLFLIRRSFSSGSPHSEYEIIREIEDAPVLIIDDLGTEQPTEFSNSLLYRIIDYRYCRELPFLASTSCSLNELAKRIGFVGEKIMQRIIESCQIRGLKGNVRAQIIAEKRGKDG